MKWLICMFKSCKWQRVKGSTKWNNWNEFWLEDCLRCGETRENYKTYLLHESYGANLCPPNSPYYKKDLEKK